MSGATGLRATLDALLQRVHLLRLQAVQLVGDAGESQFLAISKEVFALEVQLLCKSEHPDLLILFFRRRIRQAELLGGAPSNPRTGPRPRAYRIDRSRPE